MWIIGRTVVVQPWGVYGHVRPFRDRDGALLAGRVRRGERGVLRALFGNGDHRGEQPESLVEDAVNVKTQSGM